jgi:hypothetical protein
VAGTLTPVAVENGMLSMLHSPYAILKNPPIPQPVPQEFLHIQHCSASEYPMT